jgi:quinoprotein glucose dehydrogenase
MMRRSLLRRIAIVTCGVVAITVAVACLALAYTTQGRSVARQIAEKQHAGELEQAVWQVAKRQVEMLGGALDVIEMSVEPSRDDLPEFMTIPAIPTVEMTIASGNARSSKTLTSWTHSFGDERSTKFADIPWLTVPRLGDLERHWTYATFGSSANIQATPVFTGRYLVFPDARDQIVALAPETGAVAWEFDPELDAPARRGLIFVPDDGDGLGSGRIYFAASGRVFSLDAQTGEADKTFGDGGSLAVGYSVRVAPQVQGDILYVASFMPAVHAIDRHTGSRLWTLNLLSGQVSHSLVGRWIKQRVESSGANPWGGMSIDSERGLLYLTLSNPVPVAYGASRVGNNAPANSVIAIDTTTGELKWRFQEIMHDLWDLDMAAPPVLATIKRNDLLWDVVVVPTKSGNLIELDRLSGRPVFDWRLRRAPTSVVPGERTAAYQPDPELPEPFGRMAFTLDDVTDIGERNRQTVLEQLKQSNFGFFVPHEPDLQTVFFGLHGGAMQMGASLDPESGVLFVASSHVPSFFTITQRGTSAFSTIKSLGGEGFEVYKEFCAACHGDRLEGGTGPSLVALDPALGRGRFLSVINNGVRTMPAVPGLTTEQTDSLYSMLILGEGVVRSVGKRSSEVDDVETDESFQRTAYQRLNDHEGFPGSRPPWGTLTAIDLSSGRHIWRVPLGRYDELIARGIPQTGTMNMSGPVVTSGGVVFASGTTDRLIRGFNAETGMEVWEAKLPFVGSASPMVFEYDDTAYVVVPATGGGTLALYDPAIETGSTFVAFRVKR